MLLGRSGKVEYNHSCLLLSKTAIFYFGTVIKFSEEYIEYANAYYCMFWMIEIPETMEIHMNEHQSFSLFSLIIHFLFVLSSDTSLASCLHGKESYFLGPQGQERFVYELPV